MMFGPGRLKVPNLFFWIGWPVGLAFFSLLLHLTLFTPKGLSPTQV